MQKEPHATYEAEALRIQFWMGQGRIPALFYPDNLQEFQRTHSCDPLTPPRIFRQLEHLPMQEYILSKRKKTPSSKWRYQTQVESSCCSINQKYVKCPDQEGTLAAGRVAAYHYKEHFYVSKKLKMLARQVHPSPGKRTIVSLQVKKDPVREEWLLPPERPERLFQIDRITKYLS